MLWFGDERGYNATSATNQTAQTELWFGDERGYNATDGLRLRTADGCGLVMKEDITQLHASIHLMSFVVVW